MALTENFQGPAQYEDESFEERKILSKSTTESSE
jgi:hypothetical protein